MAENGTKGAGVSPEDVRRELPGWWIYRGTGQVMRPEERDRLWPVPPPWRSFSGEPDLPVPEPDALETHRRLGRFAPAPTTDRQILNRVNAAITLARPLLVVGAPGSGKSSLAYAVALELNLGRVLRWSINSRTNVKFGLYDYDSLGRAQAVGAHEKSQIGNFVHLGPLGTALLPHRLPRVLLIEEIDNGDFDLPNDLSVLFEEGEFTIPELVRIRDRDSQVFVHTADSGATAPISDGVVRCHAFPIIIITSNGERDLPTTFLRRCISVTIPEPDLDRVSSMVAAHFSVREQTLTAELTSLLGRHRTDNGGLAAGPVLNAIHLIRSGAMDESEREDFVELLDAIWQRLPEGQ